MFETFRPGPTNGAGPFYATTVCVQRFICVGFTTITCGAIATSHSLKMMRARGLRLPPSDTENFVDAKPDRFCRGTYNLRQQLSSPNLHKSSVSCRHLGRGAALSRCVEADVATAAPRRTRVRPGGMRGYGKTPAMDRQHVTLADLCPPTVTGVLVGVWGTWTQLQLLVLIPDSGSANATVSC